MIIKLEYVIRFYYCRNMTFFRTCCWYEMSNYVKNYLFEIGILFIKLECFWQK